MRFAPWMLAPSSKAKAGRWGALPAPVLAALTSADQSAMVRGYLLNGCWPGATQTQQAAPQAEQQHAQPQPEQLPEQPVEPTQAAEPSSMLLAIRVVQPEQEATTPLAAPPKESRWRRFLRAIR